jgi:hypothetical protein
MDVTVDRRRAALRRGPGLLALVVFLLCSGAGHLMVLTMLHFTLPWLTRLQPEPGPEEQRFVVLVPTEDQKVEEEDEQEPEIPDVEGQIVEVPPPLEEVKPEDAEYLAEHDQDVVEETRSENFLINPEVLAPEFSREARYETQDFMDVGADKPSTGARVGNDRFDPDRDGTLAALPSPWSLTNRDGIADPVMASHLSEHFAGAPQNDLLEEKRGERTALDTKEYLFASYLNLIRRAVNFYWEQNLDNLPRSTVISKPRYTTVVVAVLDANGALEEVRAVTASGSPEIDQCVLGAFGLASPFPNPPVGLVERDGRVYLPPMSFTVQWGTASNQFQGIDPRAGVQFPGILKSPR